MAGWQEFTGLNRGYVLELYERYRQDPQAVDARTRELFANWAPPPAPSALPASGGGIKEQRTAGVCAPAVSFSLTAYFISPDRSGRRS